MSERILIAGEPVEVPLEVQSEGRTAVADWHHAQLQERSIAHHRFTDAAVELPADVVALPAKEREAWIADETERRATPEIFAARKAQEAANAAKRAQPAPGTSSTPARKSGSGSVQAPAPVAAATPSTSKE